MPKAAVVDKKKEIVKKDGGARAKKETPKWKPVAAKGSDGD